MPADRMGVWADAPEDFSDWLCSSAMAARCCTALGVPIPGPDDYAPRAVFACYLDAVRSDVVTEAQAKGVDIRWVQATAETLARDGALWRLTAGSISLRARSCVLATGNEPRPVFGGFAPRGGSRPRFVNSGWPSTSNSPTAPASSCTRRP